MPPTKAPPKRAPNGEARGRDAAALRNLKHAVPRQSPRFVTLTKREMQLAARARERKRTPLDLKLDEYEAALTLAEEFDETLAVVMRACFRFGLEHFRQFASKADGKSPFLLGDWQPRPQHRIDPTGNRRPAPQDEIFTRPTIASHLPPPKVERIVELNEPVFSEINLPQGATVYDDRYVAEPPPTALPQVEEVMSGDDIAVGPAEAKDPELVRRIAERVPEKLPNDKASRAGARAQRIAAKKKQLQDAMPVEDENIFEQKEEAVPAALGQEEIREAAEVESEDPNDFL